MLKLRAANDAVSRFSYTSASLIVLTTLLILRWREAKSIAFGTFDTVNGRLSPAVFQVVPKSIEDYSNGLPLIFLEYRSVAYILYTALYGIFLLGYCTTTQSSCIGRGFTQTLEFRTRLKNCQILANRSSY